MLKKVDQECRHLRLVRHPALDHARDDGRGVRGAEVQGDADGHGVSKEGRVMIRTGGSRLEAFTGPRGVRSLGPASSLID